MAQAEQRNRRADGTRFYFAAQPGEGRHLIETLEAGNIVMIAHRECVEADLVGNPHLFDQRRHQAHGGFFDRNLWIQLQAKFHLRSSFNARQTRSGVNGKSRILTPVARKTAFPTAGAMETIPDSPIPLAPYGPGPSSFS